MKCSRRSKVDPFMVMDIMDQAQEIEKSGKRVIHLEVGQPSTGVSQKAMNVITNSINRYPLGYTVSPGLPELREGVSLLYKQWYNLDVDPSRVIITSGSSAAFILAFTSLFDALFSLFVEHLRDLDVQSGRASA